MKPPDFKTEAKYFCKWGAIPGSGVPAQIAKLLRRFYCLALYDATLLEVKMESAKDYDDCGGYRDTYVGGAENIRALYRKRIIQFANRVSKHRPPLVQIKRRTARKED